MFQTFKNAWKVPELRKKILFTLMIILLYRIGANLFVPYVDVAAVANQTALSNGMFGMLSMMSGDAFGSGTFFALSVSPYITASIVMQLLTIAIPPLERLSKDEDGKKKIAAATRWVTIALALITAYGYVNMLNQYGLLTVTSESKNWVFAWIVMIACYCAGASLIMWLAEKINDHGIGNGISMILFANILSGLTTTINKMINWFWVMEKNAVTGVDQPTVLRTGTQLIQPIVMTVISIALTLAAIVLIVWFTNSERRIKVIYAKKVVGRKMYGGQKTNLPLKMNMAGVMPVIFASSIVSIPTTIANLFFNSEKYYGGFYGWVQNWLYCSDNDAYEVWCAAKGVVAASVGPKPIYIILFLGLLVAFSYFYIAISFNPVEVANNIRNNGGAIIGIRPQEMAPFIKKILNRVTFMGAVFLAIIAGVPLIMAAIPWISKIGFDSIAFLGTSLLIVVGVALETVRDLEAQLSMRNYKGFLD